MAKRATEKRRTQRALTDDFKSVARRLGCDDDKKRFEQRLGKLLEAKDKDRVAKPRDKRKT